ncbi:MAG: hypothetical protein HZA50_10505 [Planctomycetes bacterium]|nr:hypothetical protein [Planctomycetota bacterium]
MSRMSLSRAIAGIPERELPDFWIGTSAGLRRELGRIRRGWISTIARSPGRHRVHLVSYGDREKTGHKANFCSAIGGGDPCSYLDKAARKRPVVLLIGPVHGHETEGLTGLANLIRIMETGSDILGRKQSEIQRLGNRCRILIVPAGNPDGLARFRPASLQGMSKTDMRFWGQGAWKNGELCGWPECKRLHPMRHSRVSFMGCYFNDAGINIMHDDFFRPMAPETAAILDVARLEGPDLAVSLHSCEYAPFVIRPAFVPLEIQEKVRCLTGQYFRSLEHNGIPHGPNFFPGPERGSVPPSFNLTSALYHVSGASALTFESPHGLLKGKGAYKANFSQLLDIHLLLYEAVFRFAILEKSQKFCC